MGASSLLSGRCQLLLLGQAIEASLEEDPDLTVLEDDALDVYSQTVAPPSPSSPRSTAGGGGAGGMGGIRGVGIGVGVGVGGVGTGGARGRLKPPGVSQPMRAIHYSRVPVPCFSCAGLVRPHPRPKSSPRRAKARTKAKPAVAGMSSGPRFAAADENRWAWASSLGSGGGVDSVPGSEFGGSGDRLGHEDGYPSESDNRAPYRQRAMLSLGSSSVGARTVRFSALLEAFSRRGRPERGMEDLRLQPVVPGDGRQELAAIDDIHASLARSWRVQAGGGRRVDSREHEPSDAREASGGVLGGNASTRKEAFAVSEIGLRTSTAKRNHWVIGRQVEGSRVGMGRVATVSGEQGSSGAEHGDVDGSSLGELYAMVVDAPIVSVGDARAAAERIFLRVTGGVEGDVRAR